ncbi:MAG: hypothetical protein ABFS12_10785 [Bacteroidota bacterium]
MKKITLLTTFLLILVVSLKAQDMFEAKRLTFDPVQEGFPTWSPDGKFIIHQHTNMTIDTVGKNGLWKISADGSGAKQIFSGIAEHPRLSPDGRYVVFDADFGNDINMIPSKGGDPIKFLPDTIRIHRGGLPNWSPDGSQIAFKDSLGSLCIHNYKTGKATRIFHKDGMLALPGCWSEDGKYVLIALMNRESRKSTIWKISSDGKDIRQITGHHENFYRYLALSPDGSLLVYSAMVERALGLYIMLTEGGNSLPLAVTPKSHNESASWSPDGKKIAFTSTRAGSFDIWIMDVDIELIIKKLHTINK